MKLAQDERMIKEWNYAIAKKKRDKTFATLAVTNRRVVYNAAGRWTVVHKELPLNCVKTLSFSDVRKSNAWAVFLIILGVFTAFTVIGIGLFLIPGIRRLNQEVFDLDIVTSGTEGSSLSVGASKKYKSRKSNANVKVKINRSVVDDMIETLGSIILENKTA